MRAIFTSNRNGLILSNSTEWISGLLDYYYFMDW